jgi:hypothetical protein
MIAQNELNEVFELLEITNKINHRQLFLERLRNSDKPTDAIILKLEEDPNMTYAYSTGKLKGKWFRVYKDINGAEIKVEVV